VSAVDPITLEVLREAFVSIVREMRVTLVRTAYSSILYEGEDFSCVLMDGDAQLVSMSKGQDHPLHIVPIGWSMKAVRESFGEDIHPGDIFLHNDPYTGGTHLNDVAMIYPLFADGRLFVFPVVRAHWGDVGGMSPGSLTGDATEIPARAYKVTGFDRETGISTVEDIGPCETVNCGRGWSQSQMNIRLSKTFRLGGRTRIAAFGEMFNLFNAVNPGTNATGVNRRVTIPSGAQAGQPDPTLLQANSFSGDFRRPEQRVGQLGIKFLF